MVAENSFVNEIKAKLDEWNGDIVKFRIIAEVAEPDDQIEHYHIIEDLVAKEKAIAQKLTEFTTSEVVDQNDLKNEIVDLRLRIETAIEAARVRVN